VTSTNGSAAFSLENPAGAVPKLTRYLVTGGNGFLGSHLFERFGWKSRTPLAEGLRRTLDWYLAAR
jgi:nucleoside-diphosphate-sugar epimerase